MRAYRPGWISLALTAGAAIFLIAPLLAVVPISLTDRRYLSLPKDSWSLQHYAALIENPAWLSSIQLSLFIAVVSAVIATLLALTFALGLWYARPRFARPLVGFVMLPLVVPPVVSAIILYFFTTSLSQRSPALGYDSTVGVILAHVVMVTPFAVITILVGLARLDRRMEMAARSLGASLSQTTFQVVLPNLKFSIAASGLLTFILSWEEIAITLFITSTETVTLPRRIWMGLRDNVDPAIAALSVVLIALTAAVLIARALWRLRGLREGSDSP